METDTDVVARAEIPRSLLFHPRVMLSSDGPGRPLAEAAICSISAVDPNFFERQAQKAAASRGDQTSPLELDPYLLLALLMLIQERQKGPNSHWFPYISLLPKEDALQLSIWWSSSDLELVRGTNLFEGTQQINNLLERVYRLFCTWGFGDRTSLVDVKWAYSIFASRSFAVYCPPQSHSISSMGAVVDTHTMNRAAAGDELNAPADSQVNSLVEPALVPLADIFNHSPTSQVRYINNLTTDFFSLAIEVAIPKSTLVPLPREVEILNNYGPKSNEGLLLSYGFCLPDNVNNSYWVQIGISDADPNHNRKLALIRSAGLWWRHHLTLSCPLPSALLQVIRISVLSDRDLELFDSGIDTEEFGGIASISNEHVTHERLLSLLEHRLSRIGIPSNSTPGSNSSALQYVTEQRAILVAAIEELGRRHHRWSARILTALPLSSQPDISSASSSRLLVSASDVINADSVGRDAPELRNALTTFFGSNDQSELAEEILLVCKILELVEIDSLWRPELVSRRSAEWADAIVPPSVSSEELLCMQGTQLLDYLVASRQRVQEVWGFVQFAQNLPSISGFVRQASLESCGWAWFVLQRICVSIGGKMCLIHPTHLDRRDTLPYHPASRWTVSARPNAHLFTIDRLCAPSCWDRDSASLEELVALFGLSSSEYHFPAADIFEATLPSACILPISFTLSDEDDAADLKLLLLERCSLSLQISLAFGRKSFELLMLVRLLLLSSDELEALEDRVVDGGRAFLSVPLSAVHEARVEALVSDILSSHRDQFGSALQRLDTMPNVPSRRRLLLHDYLQQHLRVVNWHLNAYSSDK